MGERKVRMRTPGRVESSVVVQEGATFGTPHGTVIPTPTGTCQHDKIDFRQSQIDEQTYLRFSDELGRFVQATIVLILEDMN